MSLDEFGLIGRYFSPQRLRADVRLGIGDDAAVLQPAPGHELVVTTDTLLADVHFPQDMPAQALGHRALAVNLSDLAAMGAAPAWATLALAMPRVADDWLAAFSAGFFALADQHDLTLVGGDTVKGPLAITVQLLGQAPSGTVLTRSGARPGDAVLVTGELGLAAAALRLREAGQPVPDAAAERFDRPTPRIAEGLALRGLASACIDVSDGLAADLGHILTASGCGASLDVEKLCGPTLAASFSTEEHRRLVLDGGDDYELCFTCPAHALETLAATPALAGSRQIGMVENRRGLRLKAPDGRCSDYQGQGYKHF